MPVVFFREMSPRNTSEGLGKGRGMLSLRCFIELIVKKQYLEL